MSELDEAQAAIVATLQECGLSQVIITVDGKHNLYHKQGSIAGYLFDTLAELHEQERPSPRFRQAALLEDES